MYEEFEKVYHARNLPLRTQLYQQGGAFAIQRGNRFMRILGTALSSCGTDLSYTSHSPDLAPSVLGCG